MRRATSGSLLYPTLMFRVGHVDAARAGEAWKTIPALMDEAEARRRVPLPAPRRDRAAAAARRRVARQRHAAEERATAGRSTAPTRARSRRGEVEGRRQAVDYLRFLRARVPGFENAYSLEIAPQVGIRETRRLVGEHVLSGDDVLGCASFDDTIGVNGWPLELHVAGDVEWRWPPIPDRAASTSCRTECCCRGALARRRRQPARRRPLRLDDARRPVGGARLRRLLRDGPGGRHRGRAGAAARLRAHELPPEVLQRRLVDGALSSADGLAADRPEAAERTSSGGSGLTRRSTRSLGGARVARRFGDNPRFPSACRLTADGDARRQNSRPFVSSYNPRKRRRESGMKVLDDPEAWNGRSEELAALLVALNGLRKGDASVRLPLDWPGVAGQGRRRVQRRRRAERRRWPTSWRACARWSARKASSSSAPSLRRRARLLGATSVESVNTLIDDLVHPTSEVARVIGAVAQGDLSQTMALEVDGRPLEGEFLRTAKTVNTMVDQLGSFASEVTRVAREVGTEGKLGGQAKVKGVAGTWKDLTDTVNSMAGNLTAQVRNIADVTTAVANGDLSKKITVDVKGEILELKNTINTMVDQLALVRLGSDARGARGRHRRQARRPGARSKGVAGTWKDLTDIVNSMAGNLTGQVRNIADVTTAVANGDLSQEDHGRRARARSSSSRTPSTRWSTSSASFAVGSDARGARGRHRRQARRPGRGAGRGRHVEGPDRQRQLDGRQPDRPGAQHRRGDDGRGQRRPVARRSRST